jgi:hypothetical protein
MLMQAMRKRNEAETDAPMMPPTDPTPARQLGATSVARQLTIELVVDVHAAVSLIQETTARLT